jgi:hypothetical protein
MARIHKFGKFQGDKIQYLDGIRYCIWTPLTFSPEKDNSCFGFCLFDMSENDIDDLIRLSQHMKGAEPDINTGDEDGQSEV